MQMPSAQQNRKGGVTCERAVIISKEYEEKHSRQTEECSARRNLSMR